MDIIHPLGQDYRGLAEALNVTESEMDYMYQICVRRETSPTKALLERVQPSVSHPRAICKHPGVVGCKEAVNVIDKMRQRLGHQVRRVVLLLLLISSIETNDDASKVN